MEEDKNKNSEENKGGQDKELVQKIELCEKERDEYLNGWKRARADLINYQKDEAKRFEEILKFGTTDLIKDFIPVLDSFAALERSIEGEPLASSPSRSGRPDVLGRDLNGIFLIRTQLEDALKKRGLERMIFAVGAPFDPNLHESVGEVESGEPPGAVVEEVERGYYLNGRVVRPARVKLSKQKTND